uniref:Venom protein n=1 Tax=Ampulex compressa TaxID=860918 RepID=A0A1W6EWC1_AMPCP|nr:venom protein [Ampulex compressa]
MRQSFLPLYAPFTIMNIFAELLLSTLQESIDGVIYKLCLNKPYLAKSRPSVIKAYMKSSKYWPMILDEEQAKSLYQPWWKIDNYYIQLTGESADRQLLHSADWGIGTIRVGADTQCQAR